MTNQELGKMKEQAFKELLTGDYSVDEYRATVISLLSTILEYDKMLLNTLQELKNFEMS